MVKRLPAHCVSSVVGEEFGSVEDGGSQRVRPGIAVLCGRESVEDFAILVIFGSEYEEIVVDVDFHDYSFSWNHLALLPQVRAKRDFSQPSMRMTLANLQRQPDEQLIFPFTGERSLCVTRFWGAPHSAKLGR